MINKPIRVLQVFGIMNRGGAETMIMNLYRHINRDQIQFDFVVHTNQRGDYDSEIESLGGKIYHCPRYRLYNHFQYCKWWKKFFWNHKEYRIIHSHIRSTASIYFKIAHKFGLKTIAHSHSVSNGKGIGAFVKNCLQISLNELSDYCLACSNESGRWLFKDKEYLILKNAIDTEKFMYDKSTREVIRSELNLEDSFVIGTVGGIKKVKNPFGIINIFDEVVSRCPSAKLLWVGDGDLRKDVESEISKKRLENKVILTGVKSDVSRFLQAMDVFILPSLWEGLPLVGIEAQTAGLPCIFSDRVSYETAITDQCIFLSLNNNTQWIDSIISVNAVRKNNRKEIIDSGYDIFSTTKWLEKFYLSIE